MRSVHGQCSGTLTLESGHVGMRGWLVSGRLLRTQPSNPLKALVLITMIEQYYPQRSTRYASNILPIP